VDKAFLDRVMMLSERGLLFGEGGDLGIWDQKNESERTRKQRVEKIMKLVVQRGEWGELRLWIDLGILVIRIFFRSMVSY